MSVDLYNVCNEQAPNPDAPLFRHRPPVIGQEMVMLEPEVRANSMSASVSVSTKSGQDSPCPEAGQVDSSPILDQVQQDPAVSPDPPGDKQLPFKDSSDNIKHSPDSAPVIPPKPKLLGRSSNSSASISNGSPKMSEKSDQDPGMKSSGAATDLEASPPNAGTTGSETSRSYHPEGSVDLSPSCSESLPTTPPYMKWAESIHYLLEDMDGCNLFKDYMEQQNLGYLLDFILAIRGFKNQMIHQATSPELQLRLVKTINKRYINSLGKHAHTRINFLPVEQRRSLDEKIHTKVGLDANTFDGVYQVVIEHLEAKCYPNFLTSETYIEFVQNYQQQIQEGQFSEVPSSRYSANQSSNCSSISSHPIGASSSNQFQQLPGLSKSQGPTVSALSNPDDSGISGSINTTSCPSDVQAQTSQTLSGHSSSVLSPTASTSQAQQDMVGRPTSGSSGEFPTSVSTTANVIGNPTTMSASVSHLLPTVREDSELSLPQSQHMSQSYSHSSGGARPKRSSSSHLMASSSLTSLSGPGGLARPEVHPAAAQNLTSTSYPYHANSSSWNPTSRQDSELQSQSSGALDTTTDTDNYSSFGNQPSQAASKPAMTKSKSAVTATSKATRSQQPHPAKFQQRSHHHHSQSQRPPQQRPHVGLEPGPQFIPRPKIPLEPVNLAHNPSKFAQQLIAKLSVVEQDQEKDSKLDLALDRTDPSAQRFPPPATRGLRQQDLHLEDLESDQSILDEHVDRVFNEKAHNVSRNYQHQHRHHHSGYRTLDSSKHHQRQQAHHGSHFGAHSQYRNPNTTVAGDLAYYPAVSISGASRTGMSQSFSDTDFGRPVPQRMPMAGSSSHQQHMVPYSIGYHHNQITYGASHGNNERVNDWLKNTMTTTATDHGNSQHQSPRSSGRHQNRRARSQDRFNQSLQTGFGASGGGFGRLPTTSTPGQQLNQSLPVTTTTSGSGFPPQTGSAQQQQFTTARYTFSQDRDPTPYLIKIPQAAPIMLGEIKRLCPRRNIYRYFFKTEIDGEEIFQEETNDSAFVPMFKSSVVVQCRMDDYL